MRTVVVLVALLTLPACDAVSDAVDTAACQASGYADSGSVRATVDGDAFSGSCVRLDREAGTLTIIGADNVVSQDEQEVITLALPNADVRSYTIGSDAATAAFAARTPDADDQRDEFYAAIDGQITVLQSTDTAVSGTFAFTAQNANGDAIPVTGGTFDVED